jgi:uncharacterized membrane protein YoaK (UPF0700 family)
MIASLSTEEQEHRRDVLMVALTMITGAMITGATDAIGFLLFGGAFTSVMTGNMVLLGVAGGRHELALALHTGAAFTGYAAGSYLGAHIAGHPADEQPTWPRAITRALVFEFALFVAIACWWELGNGHVTGRATYALLGINALALGVQSSTVIRFGIPGLSTTYLTGTLTQVFGTLTRRSHAVPKRSVAVLLALVGGALLGAVVATNWPGGAPFVPIGILSFVLISARYWFHDRAASSSTGRDSRS